MALPSRPTHPKQPSDDAAETQVPTSTTAASANDATTDAPSGTNGKSLPTRPQRYSTALPTIDEIDARSSYLEDEGIVPELPENLAATRTYTKDSGPLNLQGYTNIGRLTAQDLLTKDYETHYAALQEKVLSAKTEMQNYIQEKKLTEDVGEARLFRREKYDEMRQIIDQFLTRYFASQFNVKRQDIPTVSALVINEILGLGPIEPLWLDPRISEIMVNGPGHVYVEIGGKILPVPGAQFRDTQHLLEIAQQILGPINKTIDIANPLEDGRLSDGSRVNITHPAVGPGGPYMTIRRFPETTFTVRRLIETGSMTEEMAVEIGNLVAAGYSTLVVGSTGSGKTSMLNALSGCIPRDERVITIEDTLELQLHEQAHVVSMEARRSHQADGRGSISIRDLVRNALRQRPDRIIVGEVRDASAYDMLQAMNTGHDGSMTTVHANDALGGIDRLVNLMMESGDIEEGRAMSLIAGGVDLVIVIDRFPEDGSRRVVSVEEIPNRVSMEDGNIVLNPIPLFQYKQSGLEKDDEGNDHIVGEYVKVNDQSPDLVRKHRLDRKRRLSIEDIYRLSDPISAESR